MYAVQQPVRCLGDTMGAFQEAVEELDWEARVIKMLREVRNRTNRHELSGWRSSRLPQSYISETEEVKGLVEFWLELRRQGLAPVSFDWAAMQFFGELPSIHQEALLKQAFPTTRW